MWALILELYVQLHLIQALISRLYHHMEAIISKLYNLMSVIFSFILSHLNPPNLENSNQLSKIEKIKKSKSILGTWHISKENKIKNANKHLKKCNVDNI
jgi:hypothetical protein